MLNSTKDMLHHTHGYATYNLWSKRFFFNSHSNIEHIKREINMRKIRSVNS